LVVVEVEEVLEDRNRLLEGGGVLGTNALVFEGFVEAQPSAFPSVI
jgi:hypothetical protein